MFDFVASFCVVFTRLWKHSALRFPVRSSPHADSLRDDDFGIAIWDEDEGRWIYADSELERWNEGDRSDDDDRHGETLRG